MAFKVNPEAQAVFFEKVFGVSHPITNKVKSLVAVGLTFETQLYACIAKDKTGDTHTTHTTIGTTALIKGTANPLMLVANKATIAEWVNGLYQKFGFAVPGSETKPPFPPTVKNIYEPKTGQPKSHFIAQPTSVLNAPGTTLDAVVAVKVVTISGNLLLAIKAVREITSWGLKDAKTFVDAVKLGSPKYLPHMSATEAIEAVAKLASVGVTAQTEVPNELPNELTQTTAPWINAPKVAIPGLKKPLAKVVPLREAQALGQKVNGTSTGSVYYCVAISEYVKLAARILKGGSISIRAEWIDKTPAAQAELVALAESGLQIKGTYGSLHLNAQGVPAARVIGAFVLGTGIKWSEIVTSGADLKVEGA